MNSILHILRSNYSLFNSANLIRHFQATVAQNTKTNSSPSSNKTSQLINFKYFFFPMMVPKLPLLSPWPVFPCQILILVLVAYSLLGVKSHWFFVMEFFTTGEALVKAGRKTLEGSVQRQYKSCGQYGGASGLPSRSEMRSLRSGRRKAARRTSCALRPPTSYSIIFT